MPSTNQIPNFLIDTKVPNKSKEDFYEFEKLMKLDYTQLCGPETHKQRRLLIL